MTMSLTLVNTSNWDGEDYEITGSTVEPVGYKRKW